MKPWGCNQQNPEYEIPYRANYLVSTTIKFKGGKKKNSMTLYTKRDISTYCNVWNHYVS